MQIIELDADGGRAVDRFESRHASHLPLARIEGRGGLGIIRLGAGGVLGRHPAVVDQLFCVVAGEGWVSGPDADRIVVRAGQAALWSAGEEHESGTETGLTALVVEVETLTRLAVR